jgi:CHAT domain-containing protein
VFLQAQATEARVKQTDLSHYRFLAFATHGVMAGQLSGPAEPGLVLTPPSTASALDDGYLSASEVAQLKLNADWVVLSACNTAAPDGTPGAEGLSGLAKAFFYAGGRALLVSNWPVASKATQVLITTTMKTYADAPQNGKPEALRTAMLSMMDQPQYSHPFFWAPFSVVGD